MKRISALLAATAATLCATAGIPRIEWLQTTVDFGTIDEATGPTTAVFRAVNTGDAPLVILGARANCGCTVPEYDNTAVEPGDTLSLRAVYDPAGRPGHFSKKVYVDTNAEPKRSTLTVKGVVIGTPQTIAARYPADMGPLRMAHSAVLLGEVTKGHVKSIFESGYNQSRNTLRPEVRDVPAWLDVYVVNDSIVAGEQGSFNFFITPDKSQLYGLVTDTVTVIPDPANPDDSYRVPVVATFSEDFSKLTGKQLAASPRCRLTSETAAIGAVESGKPVTAEFEITNDGATPLLIRRVHSIDTGVDISAPASVKPRQKGHIRATFTPAGTEPLSMRLQLVTNDPAAPVHTLRITAEPH